MLTWPLVIKFFQYFGFVTTEILNLILLYLIITKASSKFGSYKYLMIAYAIFSMSYGVVEIVTQPIIHGNGSGFIIATFLDCHRVISTNLIMIYCASFGLCISLLATHFLYRYLAVCRPKDLHLFEGKRLLTLFLPCVFIAFAWYAVSLSLGSPSDWKSNYFEDSLEKTYHENIHRIGYYAVVYNELNDLGEFVVRWTDFIAILFCLFVMAFLLGIATFCSFHILKTLWNNKAMSSRTKDLNNQLFRALIIQFIVPLFCLLIPVETLMTFPMFRIDIGRLASIFVMTAGVYPGLDALVTILLIRDFRNAVFCRKNANPTVVFTHDTTNTH